MSLLLRILQPPIPPFYLISMAPLSGPFAHFIRLLRLLYSLLILPLVLLSAFLPSSISGMHHASWNVGQTLLMRLYSQVLWALSYGIPPRFVNRRRSTVPQRPRSVVLAEREDITACGITVPPSKAEYRKGILADSAPTEAKEVDCYWTSSGKCSDEQLTRQAREGERIIIYLVGGGYLTGEPLRYTLPWALALKTNLRVFSVNYRKADSDPANAFPAALHDVLSAWSHLLTVGFLPKNIFIAGDHAGGGLATTFTLYLLLCSLPLPQGLILYSPWLDLTLTQSLPLHPSAHAQPQAQDLLARDHLKYPALVYTQNFPLTEAGPQMLDAYRFNDREFLLSRLSFVRSGLRHPLLSPALIGPRSPLFPALKGTRFFVTYGSVERFAGEIRTFTSLLQGAGVEVITDVEEGGWHNSTADGIGGKQAAAERVLGKVVDFVGRGEEEEEVPLAPREAYNHIVSLVGYVV